MSGGLNKITAADMKDLSRYRFSGYEGYWHGLDAEGLNSLRRARIESADELFANNGRSVVIRSSQLEWDEKILGRPVRRIDELLYTPNTDLNGALSDWLDTNSTEANSLTVARVSGDNFDAIHALESAGFLLTDTMSVLLIDREQMKVKQDLPEGIELVKLSEMEAGGRAVLLEIGKHSFRNSRLYRDPSISDEAADRFYAGLTEYLFDSPTGETLVALVDSQPAGFVTFALDEELSKQLSHPVAITWLVAVSETVRGRGVGRAVLSGALEQLVPNARYVEIATQLSNLGALNLYHSLGFRAVSSICTFHHTGKA